MAMSQGFGIVFGTRVILLLVPCLYLILEDIARLFGRTSTLADRRVAAPFAAVP